MLEDMRRKPGYNLLMEKSVFSDDVKFGCKQGNSLQKILFFCSVLIGL